MQSVAVERGVRGTAVGNCASLRMRNSAAMNCLRPAVDAFFDKVLVMHQDERVRDNRLALLRSLHELFSPLADFGKLQVERA